MMPKRRAWAKPVSESSSDLNMVKSWALAVWSIRELVAILLARVCSMFGRTVEEAAVRYSRVFVMVMPAWPMEKTMISNRPQFSSRAAVRGEYFSVFLRSWRHNRSSCRSRFSR